MRRYVLSFDDYGEALRALRRLRKRGVVLRVVVVVVDVDHWNKVKDLGNGGGGGRAVIIV